MTGLHVVEFEPIASESATHHFYLAGSFKDQDVLLDWAGELERMSGWKCTSRWLHEKVEKVDERVLANAAVECRDDLDRADVLVIIAKDSSTGGLWWEFGYAVGTGMPVVIWASPECGNPFPRLDLDPKADITWMNFVCGSRLQDQGAEGRSPKWTAEQTARRLEAIGRRLPPSGWNAVCLGDEVSLAT
ncbi:MAG: hypothetical protein F4213_05670 [Boseongicola sp. SB0677_bin_26]|nr:hypothetical protein [Boseongicola sp. SB0665_bin_10]MYG25495.1 hypothetical protein [Boseongicola sp. SB0677_bin_26]